MKKVSENWLKDHENIERQVQVISLEFNERNKYPKSSSNYSKITRNIRTSMAKLNNSINELSRNLDDSSDRNLITSLEKNRRTTMVNQLKISLKQFEENLRDNSMANKEELISFDTDNETTSRHNDEILNFTSEQLLMQQDRILSEQDRGIETLSHIISNQKNIATSIGREVDRQNAMIDSMEGKMDTVHERLITQTKRIRFIDKKSSTCGIWVLIVLLLILIIVLAAIPKR